MIGEGEFMPLKERLEGGARRLALKCRLAGSRLGAEDFGKPPSHLRVTAGHDWKEQGLRHLGLPGIEFDLCQMHARVGVCR